jgi:steroid delta-isomerase-like uncharacterized protein
MSPIPSPYLVGTRANRAMQDASEGNDMNTRRFFELGLGLVVVLAMLATHAFAQVRTPAAAVRGYVTAFNDHDFDAIGVRDDVTVHLAGDVLQGHTAYRALLASLIAGYPDMRIQLHDLISTDDYVAARWTMWGTQGGVIPMASEALALFRVEDGLIAEKWYRETGPRPAPADELGAKNLVRAYVSAFNAHDFDALAETVREDIVVHGLLGTDGDVHGQEAYAAALAAWHVTFPDLRISDVHELFCDGNVVSARWTVVGTQDGPFGEMPATGRFVTVEALALFRLEGGLIAEKWYRQDDLGLLAQLGATD